MDFTDILTSLPMWSALLPVVLVLLYIYGNYPMNTWKKLEVPGPPTLPFIGNAHQIFFGDIHKGREQVLKLTKKYGKIMGVLMFRQPSFYVTDVEAVKEIMIKNFNNYGERYFMEEGGFVQKELLDSLPFQKAHIWKENRKIITPSFSGKQMRVMATAINLTSCQLTKKLENYRNAGEMAPIKYAFAAFSLDVFTSTFLGFNLNTQENPDSAYLWNAQELVKLDLKCKISMFISVNFPFMRNALRHLNISLVDNNRIRFYRNAIRKLVSDRKSDPDSYSQSDFLHSLLQAEEDPKSSLGAGEKNCLTSDEVVSNASAFFMAAFEATSISFRLIVYCIAKHKFVQDILVEEIKIVVGDSEDVTFEMCQCLCYMEAVMTEALRLYSPIAMTTRLALEDTTLKGYKVPKGTPIYIPLAAINKDPDVFKDPDTFNPDRFISKNGEDDEDVKLAKSIASLPFGLGPRICIGMRLAFFEIKIALVHLLRTFEFVDVIPRDLKFQDLSFIASLTIPIKLKLARR